LEELILTALQIEMFIGLYCPLGLPDKSSLILLLEDGLDHSLNFEGQKAGSIQYTKKLNLIGDFL
jgi:hypothetical protein